MTLNKDDKIKILNTLKMFKDYEKQEVKESKGDNAIEAITGINIVYQNDYELIKDAELLKEFAEKVLTYIKNNQPQLLEEIKNTYFK